MKRFQSFTATLLLCLVTAFPWQTRPAWAESPPQSSTTHWSFIPPKRPAVPALPGNRWPRNTVDRFILARLDKEGLQPAPAADREALIRRVSFDLTGLPPTLEEIDAFLADASPHAYESLVDRLLASPGYGERMAVDWLDAARYADTNGYHIDNGRDMWLWRDWVIHAFNENLPFDEFTVLQLAGDLLPQATPEQRTASAFNRNHGVNFEAGAIAEEYRVEYVIDRVQTTSTVWLGLTIGCAQCHDHKYDPFSQRDFYRLFAFFNTIEEQGLDGRDGNAAPKLEAVSVFRGDHASVMVMQEMPQPRRSFVLRRGSYASPGEQVAAGTPPVLGALPSGAAKNRLSLARWLVGPHNPLTARVVVNRYWQLIFGTGLVKTSEDFGTQGERPTHPQLLDWLATGLVASGWDTKALLRLLVTSATYRQASAVSPPLLERDPENRLLARGPRLRLPAELIRDQALAVSGLLCERLGGPSVFPYQPSGLWRDTAHENFMRYTAQKYDESEGADLYRRSVYSFWKRSSPPPAMLAFDAPTRETCVVRRQRTNTPLQALALMNDQIYIEASRVLAARLWEQGWVEDPPRLAAAFRHVTGRPPDETELRRLLELYQRQLAEFRRKPASATALLRVGKSPAAGQIEPAAHAAMAYTISLMFNLSETIVKR